MGSASSQKISFLYVAVLLVCHCQQGLVVAGRSQPPQTNPVLAPPQSFLDDTPRPLPYTIQTGPVPQDSSVPVSSSGPSAGRLGTFIKRLRSSSNMIPRHSAAALDSLKSKILALEQPKHLRHRNDQDLKTATGLSGGAEPPVEDQSEIPGTPETSSSSATAPSRKSTRAFLGDLGMKKKRPLTPTNGVKAVQQRNNGVLVQKVKDGLSAMQKTSSKVAPSFLTAASLFWASEHGISFLSLYGLALLGASCGFYMFLYFITVGYSLGITLPLAAALHIYKKNKQLTFPTYFHSAITVAWGIRTLVFFVWREFVSWPALHQKVIEIQNRMDIPFSSRVLCWCVYSFFYVAMMSMNWSRLKYSDTAKWGPIGFIGLLLQVTGFGLESVADLQKNGFKSRHRHAWCNVGLWKWSTHPNYLGEGLFWWGTYLAHGFNSILHSLLATIGLGFITFVLKGSTHSLTLKQLEKYGDQPPFFEFQRTHSIWGPKRWWWWLHGLEELSEPQFSVVSMPQGMNITNTSVVEDATNSPVES